MPTAARLVAALCLAVLGAVVSEMVKPLMPESIDFGYLTSVNFGLGLVVGWTWLGARAGRGTTDAINNGVTSVLVLVAVALLVQGANEMLRQALRSRFHDPLDAIRSILAIALDYGQYLLDARIILTLLAGALFAGILTEMAWRRWR